MAEDTKRMLDIDGRQVAFVEIADMTLDELEHVMERTGMAAVEAETALRMGNPLIWKAVLNVAARRGRPGANVDAAVGKMKITELLEVIYPDEKEEEEQASPPEDAGDPPAQTSSTAAIRAVSGSR